MLEIFKEFEVKNQTLLYGGQDIIIKDDMGGREIIIEEVIGG